MTTYLGVLRAQAVAVPVNPRSTVGELARMIEDSGSRIVVADADTVATVREAHATLEQAPRLVVVGATLRPGERGYDQLRATTGAAGAAAPGPGEAGGAPLHERYVGPAARRDAHPPRAARQHRPGRPGGPADDPRRRRRARGAPALPRLRPQRRARGRAPAPRQARARRAVRPAGDAGDHRRRGVQRRARRASGLRLLAARGAPRGAPRPGAADPVRVGAAVAGGRREVHRPHRHPRAPGLRPDRGVTRW